MQILLFLFLQNNAFAYSKKNDTTYEEEFDNYEALFTKKNTTQIYDPLEPINRKIFAFNDFIDTKAIEPSVKLYHNLVHDQIRKAIKNFTNNLSLPMSALNSFAQGQTNNTLSTISSFLINSTIGCLGLFDIAGQKGIKYEKEDFGQTLGTYGFGSGAYIVLPIFGPSSVRDTAGFATDSAISPTGFNLLKFGQKHESISNKKKILISSLTFVSVRESLLNAIRESHSDSFDLYATFRSAYLQQRNSKIQINENE